MLIFESDLLNALDFLFVISGAPIESIEERLLKDRQRDRARSLQILKEERDRRNGFFLIKDQDHFVELFFLKISFLDQIVRRVFPNLEGYQHPELGCSLNRIWIQLADAGNMIPLSWSFKVRLIQDDLDKATAKPPSFPKSPPAYGYYFLGLIWLFTLVLNRRQGSTTICSAAEKMVEQNLSAGDSDRNRDGGALDPVFSPENIYWKPDANQKPNTDRKIWEKSIQMGLSLLQEGLNPSRSVIPEDFIQELDFLRGEIRKSLFQRRSSAAPGPRLSREDPAIRNILIQLRNRLSGHAEEALPLENSSDEENEDSTEETSESEMAETVILHRGKSSKISVESEKEEKLPEETALNDDDLVETVAIFSGRAQKEKNEIEPEGELEETVMLHRRDFGKTPDEEDEDIMSETVILRPGGTEKEE